MSQFFHGECNYRQKQYNDYCSKVEVFFDEGFCLLPEEVEKYSFGAESEGSEDNADKDEFFN